MQQQRQPHPADHAILGFIVWVAICFCAAAFGGLFRPGEWYAHLTKPSWTPPGAVFGPVWTVLYFLMATAAWLVWRGGGFARHRTALRLFLGQLLLNAAWSPFSFGLKSLGLSLLDILALWVVLLLTLRWFFKAKPLAGWLMVPYAIWVTFASALNFALWRLNPSG